MVEKPVVRNECWDAIPRDSSGSMRCGRGPVQYRGSPATRSIRCSEYPRLPNRRPPGQADPPFRPRTKVRQGKCKAWRRRLSRLDAGRALSFGRSGGEFSGPAPCGWPSSTCGCTTACVAAENLGRRWIGVDISPEAVELVNMRLQQSMGDLFHNRLVTARTDIDAPMSYRQNKHALFGQQANIESFQLLCAHRNCGRRPGRGSDRLGRIEPPRVLTQSMITIQCRSFSPAPIALHTVPLIQRKPLVRATLCFRECSYNTGSSAK